MVEKQFSGRGRLPLIDRDCEAYADKCKFDRNATIRRLTFDCRSERKTFIRPQALLCPIKSHGISYEQFTLQFFCHRDARYHIDQRTVVGNGILHIGMRPVGSP